MCRGCRSIREPVAGSFRTRVRPLSRWARGQRLSRAALFPRVRLCRPRIAGRETMLIDVLVMLWVSEANPETGNVWGAIPGHMDGGRRQTQLRDPRPGPRGVQAAGLSGLLGCPGLRR